MRAAFVCLARGAFAAASQSRHTHPTPSCITRCPLATPSCDSMYARLYHVVEQLRAREAAEKQEGVF